MHVKKNGFHVSHVCRPCESNIKGRNLFEDTSDEGNEMWRLPVYGFGNRYYIRSQLCFLSTGDLRGKLASLGQRVAVTVYVRVQNLISRWTCHVFIYELFFVVLWENANSSCYCSNNTFTVSKEVNMFCKLNAIMHHLNGFSVISQLPCRKRQLIHVYEQQCVFLLTFMQFSLIYNGQCVLQNHHWWLPGCYGPQISKLTEQRDDIKAADKIERLHGAICTSLHSPFFSYQRFFFLLTG